MADLEPMRKQVRLKLWDPNMEMCVYILPPESRRSNSHVLVYHGPGLFATFWELRIFYFPHSVYIIYTIMYSQIVDDT